MNRRPARATIGGLSQATQEHDHARPVVDAHDTGMSRGRDKYVVRDNVIFELGDFWVHWVRIVSSRSVTGTRSQIALGS